jgi:hypothetical protein
MDYIIIEEEALGYDFQHFLSFSNTYAIKSKGKLKYPKSLIIAVIKELEDYGKRMFIDITKYSFIRITQFESVTYQVEFHQTNDVLSPDISFYSIYFDSKRRKLLQWNVDLNQ